MDAPRAWADLPAGTLTEIAGHVHDAADFTRFHAVCRSWREASPATPTTLLLPWLIQPIDDHFSSGLRFHAPFSSNKRKQTVYIPHAPALRSRRFEFSDAARGRLLAAGIYNDDRAASLVDPLTGDATVLPDLPRKLPKGLVSRDGSVLFESGLGRLSAAVLRPGKKNDRWEHVDVACPVGMSTREAMLMSFLDPDDVDRVCAALCSSGVLAGGRCAVPRLPPKLLGVGQRFVLESPIHGELLCFDVLPGLDKPYPPHQTTEPATVAVHVHALELDDGGTPWWTARDGVDERVCLFLGYKSSFAVDAREFSGSAEVTGSCAYFVGRHPECSKEVHAVFRYSFKDGTATVVHELPAEFGIMSMWFGPRPRISPLTPRPAGRNPYVYSYYFRL